MQIAAELMGGAELIDKLVPTTLSPQQPMARLDPFSLQMQITRMFEQEQSFFATTKVQDWLREHNEDPNAYSITFVQKPAPPSSNQVMVVEIGLQRRDNQPVDAWLLEEINRWS